MCRGENVAYRILIADDSAAIRDVLREALVDEGYDVSEAASGDDVLAEFNGSGAPKPDLVLMDIQLPEVSGLDVAKWIRDDETLKGTPVIAVTAFAMSEDDQKIKDAGCITAIPKPISVKPFLELVAKTLTETVV